jgi:hypothetical protein
MKKTILILFLICFGKSLFGQESETIQLHNSEGDSGRRVFSYLPCWLRVAEEDNQPQVSLIEYKDAQILHLILTWGLDEDTEKVMERTVLKRDSTAIWLGAYDVTTAKVEWSFEGDETLKKLFVENLKSSSPVPNYPLGKQAFSFHFKGEASNMFKEILRNNPEKLESLVIKYRFFLEKDYKVPHETSNNFYQLLKPIIK